MMRGSCCIRTLEQQDLTLAPLQKERWVGGIDSVGGQTLVNALSQTAYGGAGAVCGLADSADLPATVLPFILRGVALLGIESVNPPRERRNAAWARLAHELDNPDKVFSGYGLETIAGLKVALGLERVDLVGSDGGDDVNEGVDDGSMLGQIEG